MRLLLILFVLTLNSLNASHVKWFGDYESAYKQAIKEKKTLMVLLLDHKDSTCQEIIKTTFSHQSYIDKINKDYISVIVMKGQKESYPIEMLYTRTYPTLFFLDNKELFICEPLTGKITPDKLKNYLKGCSSLMHRR